MKLTDYLEEGIGERTLHHYTTTMNILSVLKDGNLKAQNYYTGGKKGKFQLCTARPSSVTKQNVKELSHGAGGGVKVVIDASKLSDNVRGAKIETIDEFPVAFVEIAKRNLMTKTKGVREAPSKKEVNMFVKELGKAAKLRQQPRRTETSRLAEKYKMSVDDIADLMTGTATATRMGREGEERITVPCQKIPLDKRYVQIEIDNQFLTDIKHYKRSFDENKKNILKYKDLFIQNNAFKKVLEMIGDKNET